MYSYLFRTLAAAHPASTSSYSRRTMNFEVLCTSSNRFSLSNSTHSTSSKAPFSRSLCSFEVLFPPAHSSQATMSNLDVSLDDLIKKNKTGARGGARGGRGGTRGGRGGARTDSPYGGGPSGPVRRANNRAAYRSAPYARQVSRRQPVPIGLPGWGSGGGGGGSSQGPDSVLFGNQSGFQVEQQSMYLDGRGPRTRTAEAHILNHSACRLYCIIKFR
jgi:hypothetical protein